MTEGAESSSQNLNSAIANAARSGIKGHASAGGKPGDSSFADWAKTQAASDAMSKEYDIEYKEKARTESIELKHALNKYNQDRARNLRNLRSKKQQLD